MSLTSPSHVRRILDELGACPKKALGQNFLVDRNILNILLDAAALDEEDSVLEIGPGLGVLTAELVARVRSVCAVEKDSCLAAYLRDLHQGEAGVEILNTDVLRTDLRDLPARGFTKVVANLPYNVASRILMEMAIGNPPGLVVVTVQKEVADRIVAAPGGKSFGILGLWLGSVFEVEYVKTISRTCFWPPPAVQSAIVRLTKRDVPLLPEISRRETFYQLTRYAFMHRRKQLAALMAQAIASPSHTSTGWRSVLESVSIDPQSRPEDVFPACWVALLDGPLRGATLHAELCSRRWDSLSANDL